MMRGTGSPNRRDSAFTTNRAAIAAIHSVSTHLRLHRIIPADCIRCLKRRAIVCTNPEHDIRRRAPMSKFIGHEFHVRVDVVEEELVGGTEVIQSGLALGRAG